MFYFYIVSKSIPSWKTLFDCKSKNKLKPAENWLWNFGRAQQTELDTEVLPGKRNGIIALLTIDEHFSAKYYTVLKN